MKWNMKETNSGDEECGNVPISLLLSNLITYKPFRMLLF